MQIESDSKKNNYANLTNLHSFIQDNVIQTVNNTLITGFKIGGRNPSSLTEDDFNHFSIVLRNIFAPISSEVDFSFIQINNNFSKLRKFDCKNIVAKEITHSRIDYLNKKGINRSDIYVILEFNVSFSKNGGVMLYQPNIVSLFKAILNFDWDDIKNATNSFLSEKNTYISNEKITKKSLKELAEESNSCIERLRLIMEVEPLKSFELWNLASFLVNYQINDLYNDNKNHPISNLHNKLHRGDVHPVTRENSPLMLIRAEDDVYVKFGSIKGFESTHVKSGWFSSDKESPLNAKCNMVMVMRFKSLNPIQKSLFFSSKKNEIKRLNVKLGDLLTGKSTKDVSQLYVTSNVKREKELDEAESIPERWGLFSCHFALFGKSEDIVENTYNIKSKFESVGCSIVWENSSMFNCYQNMQLNIPNNSIRDFVWNLQQFSAVVPVYKESAGTLKDTTIDREYVFPFTTPQNKIHMFSLWDNGSGINLICAPIRRGKSFLKNTIATHFGKYDGLYRSIDIDDGTEPVAQIYGSDGVIFDIDPNKNGGFNPFALLTQENKSRYSQRIKLLIEDMIMSNSSQEMRNLSKTEQSNLEEVINRFIYGEKKEHLNFRFFYSDLNEGLREKLQSFFDGVYGSLYSAENEEIGTALNKMYAIYNLKAIKDQPVLKELAMSEIFFRVRENFSSQEFRSLPKYLDIDEAHTFLKNKKNIDNVINFGRTSGKDGAGIGLTTQHPNDFGNLSEWSTLKSAANSMIFLNDINADYDSYNKVFGLNRSEIETIKIIQPRKEALIVRRNLGISQVVVLDVDPKQYAMTTSHHLEASKRNDFINKYGFKKGIEHTIDYINERKQKNEKNNYSLDEGFI